LSRFATTKEKKGAIAKEKPDYCNRGDDDTLSIGSTFDFPYCGNQFHAVVTVILG